MSLQCAAAAATAVSPKGTQIRSDKLSGHNHPAHHVGGQQGATPRRCGCWRSAPAASCWPQPRQKARRCCGAPPTLLCWGRCPHRQRQVATAAAAVRPWVAPLCSPSPTARHSRTARRRQRLHPRIARRSCGSGADTVLDHCSYEMYRSGKCRSVVVHPYTCHATSGGPIDSSVSAAAIAPVICCSSVAKLDPHMLAGQSSSQVPQGRFWLWPGAAASPYFRRPLCPAIRNSGRRCGR